MDKNYEAAMKSASIRKALAEKAESGNTSFIHESDVKKHGGNGNVWRHYDSLLTEMEELARSFVEYYYMVLGGNDSADIDERALKRDKRLKALNSKLIEKKKELLKWVDPEQKHRCSTFDGVVIAEMAHSIIAQKNNVEGEKGFKSRSAHTFAPRRAFRHRLEAHMGILLTGADLVGAEHAYYLRVEKQLLGKVRGAERAKNEVANNKAKYIAFTVDFLADTGEPYPEEAKEKRIKEFDEKIKELDKDIESAKKELAEFHKEHRDQRMSEPTIQEEMGQAKKEEETVAILEKVSEMTPEKKKEVMGVLKLKERKGEKEESLNKRIAEAMYKFYQATKVAEPEKAEPEKAVAEAK